MIHTASGICVSTTSRLIVVRSLSNSMMLLLMPLFILKWTCKRSKHLLASHLFIFCSRHFGTRSLKCKQELTVRIEWTMQLACLRCFEWSSSRFTLVGSCKLKLLAKNNNIQQQCAGFIWFNIFRGGHDDSYKQQQQQHKSKDSLMNNLIKDWARRWHQWKASEQAVQRKLKLDLPEGRSPSLPSSWLAR